MLGVYVNRSCIFLSMDQDPKPLPDTTVPVPFFLQDSKLFPDRKKNLFNNSVSDLHLFYEVPDPLTLVMDLLA